MSWLETVHSNSSMVKSNLLGYCVGQTSEYNGEGVEKWFELRQFYRKS